MRPPISAIVLLLLIVVPAVTLACGDDTRDGAGTPRPSPTRGTPSLRETATPTPAGEKTPPAAASPTATTGANHQPSPVPTAQEGTPAIAPADQNAFLQQFQGQAISEQPCIYNPSSRVTDCGGFGRFAVDPPLPGQDVNCALLVLNNEGRAIRCTSREPAATLYYEIRR